MSAKPFLIFENPNKPSNKIILVRIASNGVRALVARKALPEIYPCMVREEMETPGVENESLEKKTTEMGCPGVLLRTDCWNQHWSGLASWDVKRAVVGVARFGTPGSRHSLQVGGTQEKKKAEKTEGTTDPRLEGVCHGCSSANIPAM
ncbi:hypothetical protein MLD38_005151 [Melastoma candidum]|uniref:Uncharacterized protein n=1 Tax=Melastoma candidum TaxID=119954 RepID=A0ACB9S8D3_9MYRT|nr:hypothetical protein MLD38_005151 [Melastoma candidum]